MAIITLLLVRVLRIMRNTKIIKAQLEASRYMAGYSETLMLPVTVLSTFLGVALHGVQNARPGDELMSLEELAERMGISPSSMSAHLRYLSANYRDGKPGMGLVFLSDHPENRRKRTFGLTRSGTAVVEHLEGIYLKAMR